MALDLGKQVGPLPVGAWIAVVGGGLAIGWYFSSGSAKGGGSGDVPLVPVTEPGVGTGGGQFIYDPPTNVDNPTDNKITDNSTWGRRAINWLIAKGYDPGTSQSAVSKFLNGTNRTLTEQTLINLALIEFGSPPEDVPLVDTPVTPPPVTPPPTKPPVTPPKPPVPDKRPYWYHTVRAGETIGTISAKYKTSWWNIYVTNDMIGLRPDGSRGLLTGPWALKIGMLLVIPNPITAVGKPPPAYKNGPIRYYTVQGRGETVTQIGKKYNIHPANIFIANDVVGNRADGTRGFLVNPSQMIKPGVRLIIPYQ